MGLWPEFNFEPLHKKITVFIVKLLKILKQPSWVQAIATVAIVFITLYVTCTANRILKATSETSNRISKEIAQASEKVQFENRRANIKPELRLTAKRVGIGNKEASGIVVTVINIGTGAAKDLVIMIWEGEKPNPHPFQTFFKQGIFPILKPPQIQNIPLTTETKPIIDLFYMEPIVPDTGFGQNFIRSGEVLEFQYGCYPFGKTPVIFPMTLIISYFDIDGIEYTTVTRLVPGFGHVPLQYEHGHPIFDTLKELSQGVGLYHYKTYLNLGLRDSTSIFKYTPNSSNSNHHER